MPAYRHASVALLCMLAGCASLPTSGPTGSQIRKSLSAPPPGLPVAIVEVSSVEKIPASADKMAAAPLLPQVPAPPTDLVGPGDILEISIYEAGVTLFAGSGGAVGGTTAATGLGATGAQVQRLPLSRVNDAGEIVIPYAGTLKVAGRTITEIQAMIQRSLRKLSQNPQVLIAVSQGITNTVIVSGEVARPGRLPLQTNQERLSDIVALSGGYRGNVRDLVIRVTRGTQMVEVRLDDLNTRPELDVPALPGDRIALLSVPRSFSVLGASGRVEQLPFARSRVSLAEAIAQAGGANPNAGDAAAIFLFRYVPDADGGETPVVYHVNMMKADAYFLTQRFTMRDKDILYFGNAASNRPAKLFQLISQLFTPLVTVTAATQALQN